MSPHTTDGLPWDPARTRLLEVRISCEAAAAVAAVISELAGLSRLAPELVIGELRPILASLRARRRECFRCGLPFIQKQNHRRPRAFCGEKCKEAARRGE